MNKNFQATTKNIIAKQLIKKVVFYAGIVAILLTFIMGFISYRFEIKSFSQQFEEIKKSYYEVIRSALWIHDKEMINTVLIGLCSLPGIQYADIHVEPDFACSTGKKTASKWNSIFSITHVYKGKNIKLGELHIQGDANYIQKKIMKIVIIIAFAQAVTISIICCLMLWLMNNSIIIRLLKITSYTSNLSFENITTPLVMDSRKVLHDELDALSDGINQMRKNVHQSYIREQSVKEQLKKSHDILEVKVEERTKELNVKVIQLQEALSEIKKLSGLLPICSHCKKIRDDKGYWNQIEEYIQKHSEAEFSHGMCPECSDELYGKEDWYIEMKKEERESKE